MDLLLAVLRIVGIYVFLFPILLCVVWIVGSLYYWRRFEVQKAKDSQDLGQLKKLSEKSRQWRWSAATILVPCRNEEGFIRSTCRALTKLNYPDYRVVFIDDASSDDTVSIIQEEIADLDHFHLLRLEEHQGKARALNQALDWVCTPVTVVIDADTLLTPEALCWLIRPLMSHRSLGAVTGNPYAFNRVHLIERLQTAEFASIIGLIKRAQCMIGKLLTVSGCVAAYRTDVLRMVEGFSDRSATEDIDITWRIQKQGYDVWFEPRGVAFIRVPDSLRGYWKQRARWSLGGWHLLREHRDVFKRRAWRGLWPIYLEFSLAYFWAFCFILGTLLWVVTAIALGVGVGFSLFAAWYGAIISVMCLLQFAVAMRVNHPYDGTLWRSFFWIPWYPIFFFAVNALAVVRTSIKGMWGDLEDAGKW